MAKKLWRGGGGAVDQVVDFVFGGTWEADDLVRVLVGNKSHDFEAGSSSAATIVLNLAAGWSGGGAEFGDITPTANGSTLTLSSAESGVPFTVSMTPLERDGSASGGQQINGGTSTTSGTTVRSSKSPNDWNTASNWADGSVPAGGDEVDLGDSEFPIWYGLDQSAVSFSLVRCGSTSVGLPEINEAGYVEYRARSLVLQGCPLHLGAGSSSTAPSPGPSFFSVRFTSQSGQVRVLTTQGALEGSEAVRVQGQVGTLDLIQGSVAGGLRDIESASFGLVNVGTPDGASASFRGGLYCTVDAVVKHSGSLTVENPDAMTLTNRGGDATLLGEGTVAMVEVSAGTVNYNCAGMLTGAVVSGTGLLTFDGDPRPKSLGGAIDVYGQQANVSDMRKVVSGFAIDFNHVTVTGFGTHVRLTRGLPA